MSDTPAAPPEGNEPDAPPIEPIEPIEPVEPVEPSAEEILEAKLDKRDQQMKSWQGRKDKDLFDNLRQLIDEKLQTTPKQAAEFDFENPTQQVEKLVDQRLTQREANSQKFMQSVVNSAAAIMESDEIFEDKELGNAVIEVIRTDISKIGQNVAPDIAADLLVSKATRKVLASQRKQQKTAFDGKVPGKVPGTLTPEAKAKEAKMPAMSEKTAALAKRWGYDAKQLNKVFGDGTT